MGAPFNVNSVFRSAVVDDNADKCLKVKKVMSFLPLKIAEFFNWMFNGEDISDGFRAQLWPVGSIMLSAVATGPDGRWLECNGASVLRETYPDLFDAIGTQHGAVDGDHFNLPDTRGRAVVGTGVLTNVDLTTGATYNFAAKAGSEEVVLESAQIAPPLANPGVDKMVINDASSVGANATLAGASTNGKVITPEDFFDTGDDVEGHDNVSPVLVLRYWIAY